MAHQLRAVCDRAFTLDQTTELFLNPAPATTAFVDANGVSYREKAETTTSMRYVGTLVSGFSHLAPAYYQIESVGLSGASAESVNVQGVVYPDVYVCPVNLTLKAGRIDADGVIQWNQEVLDLMIEAKKHPHFDGCIGVTYPHSEEVRGLFPSEYVAGGGASNGLVQIENGQKRVRAVV